MSQSLAARLHGAVGEDRVHTAVVVRGVYQPVGGPGSTVMPPTYPIGEKESVEKKYAVHHRLLDGGEPVSVVTVDQEPAQANRVEEALLRARDREQLAYPLFEMRCKSAHGEVRLTSLEFPHRYADAYLRDSLVDGRRFDESSVGRLLRSTTTADVRPLYERDPGSLVTPRGSGSPSAPPSTPWRPGRFPTSTAMGSMCRPGHCASSRTASLSRCGVG